VARVVRAVHVVRAVARVVRAVHVVRAVARVVRVAVDRKLEGGEPAFSAD
jgi:hypothetical protein